MIRENSAGRKQKKKKKKESEHPAVPGYSKTRPSAVQLQAWLITLAFLAYVFPLAEVGYNVHRVVLTRHATP